MVCVTGPKANRLLAGAPEIDPRILMACNTFNGEAGDPTQHAAMRSEAARTINDIWHQRNNVLQEALQRGKQQRLQRNRSP